LNRLEPCDGLGLPLQGEDMRFLLCLFVATASIGFAQTVRLSDAQALEIGRRIWKNECGGTVNGLTSWNVGEEFASLGIAHFIWYPEGKRGPFEESFPKLIRYLAAHGARIPVWVDGTCPWRTRAAFVADFQSPKMLQLRDLLESTVAKQARFATLRLEEALPKMLAAGSPSKREEIRANFYRVAAERLGPYALVDYVNFKGEGVNPAERYRGHGWGLLQVLEAMPAAGPPLPSFVKAADQVLTRRVANSPPARNESRWLPGWRNRLETYLD
jgi:hypothetical protein